MVKVPTRTPMLGDSFSRAPDSRWQAAVQLANKPHVFCQSDVLVRRTASCIRLQGRAQASAARKCAEEKFPTITTAQRIRFDPSDGRRVAIEARVLAGYPPREIARRAALDLAVVWTYIALFFDVLDRLDAEDFIWTQVVGFQNGDADEQELERKAMMWLSWIGGPLKVNAFLLPGRSVGLAEREEDMSDHLLAAAQALITRAMALAPLLNRLDREQARQFTRWGLQASQQREADIGDRSRNDYLNNVRAFLEGIELSVGRSTIPKDKNEKYHTGPIEPRASELCAIARGEDVAELDARIAACPSIDCDDDVHEVSDAQDGRTVS